MDQIKENIVKAHQTASLLHGDLYGLLSYSVTLQASIENLCLYEFITDLLRSTAEIKNRLARIGGV